MFRAGDDFTIDRFGDDIGFALGLGDLLAEQDDHRADVGIGELLSTRASLSWDSLADGAGDTGVVRPCVRAFVSKARRVRLAD